MSYFIQITGLRRSGNHAIINWLRGNFEDAGYKVRHDNDSQLLRTVTWHPCTDKEVYIVSFEDQDIKVIPKLPDHVESFNFIILRDPFNCLASRMRRGYSITRELYLSYANEFVGKTNFVDEPKCCVNYNRWLIDYNYRSCIIQRFGLVCTDAHFHTMSEMSSFGDTIPEKEHLISRWKFYDKNIQHEKYGIQTLANYCNNELYWEWLSHAEIRLMSLNIFNFEPLGKCND
jgi:hypothetical protein